MTKPIEYRMRIAGFGVWRILYVPTKRRWELAYTVRATGEQWMPCGEFVAPESAAIAVAERKTEVPSWRGLRFAMPASIKPRAANRRGWWLFVLW
jgi:hypothetical protein